MTEAVTVADLSVRYGDLVAVDGVSFTAHDGEVLALLGPNGAGKTSTVEVVEGFRRPDRGTVRVRGLDPVRDHAEIVGRLGVMLQDGGVYPGIRPGEMLELCAALYPDALDPDELLERMGLGDRRATSWRQLSGGEQQRLRTAMAIVGRPDVVVLDEPTAGVDVRGRQLIRELLRELAGQGCCVVLCTHELDEAERVADRAVIVDRGRVVAEGTVAELRADASRVRFSAPPGIDVVALGNHLGVAVMQENPGEYELSTGGDPHLIARLATWLADRGLALGDLRAGRQRLEDVFLELTSTPDPPTSAGGRGPRRRERRAR